MTNTPIDSYRTHKLPGQEFLLDKGIFISQSFTNFRLLESFDTISNLLKTVKEYRDYAQPDTPSWEEYIQEYFQLLGFSTDKISQRVMLLSDLGSTESPKAVAGFILPGEDLDFIVPWLSWTCFLSYPAQIYGVDWIILTDGINLKVFYFRGDDFANTYLWANIDGIIKTERMDSFFTLYKVFSYIKGQNNGLGLAKDKSTRPIPATPTNNSVPSPVKKSHTLNNSQVKSPELPGALINIFYVCREVFQTGVDFERACEIVAKRRKVTATTLRDSCTRRIHLRADGFCKLLENKSALSAHLKQKFPKCTVEIRKEIERYYEIQE